MVNQNCCVNISNLSQTLVEICFEFVEQQVVVLICSLSFCLLIAMILVLVRYSSPDAFAHVFDDRYCRLSSFDCFSCSLWLYYLNCIVLLKQMFCFYVLQNALFLFFMNCQITTDIFIVVMLLDLLSVY